MNAAVLRTPPEEELIALKGTTIRVADLLALFGTRVRNDQSVLLITQALKDVGLSTHPYFATCNQRTEVHVVALESASGTEPSGSDEEEDGLPSGALSQQSFKIGDIPAAHSGVESVTPGASLTQAMYLMRTKNYSQIPVMADRYTLTGVVTWRSVAWAFADRRARDLVGAIEDAPPVAPVYQEFFSLLPTVSEYGYVLVRANDGHVSGIVTAADITERFDATAWPFFVIGEIEYRLRKCLGARLDPESIKAVQRYDKTGQIADLMFGDYVKLLDGDQRNKNGQRKEALCAAADRNWQALGWGAGVDHVEFVRQLDRVRRIRNKIAHFDPEPLSPERTEELRQFVGLLRQLT